MRKPSNRKCKYCDRPAKKNIVNGRNKGYLRTCGSEDCLMANYKDADVCARRNTPNDTKMYVCAICEELYERRANHNVKYCTSCVPSRKWQTIAKRYGIGKKDWDRLCAIQGGTCALCDSEPSVVDHDHGTGKVRGLLCHHCNHIVTGIEKGDEWISKAKMYLSNQLDSNAIKNLSNAI